MKSETVSSETNYWQGNIHEILVFNRFLDDFKKNNVEWYLSKKGDFGLCLRRVCPSIKTKKPGIITS